MKASGVQVFNTVFAFLHAMVKYVMVVMLKHVLKFFN